MSECMQFDLTNYNYLMEVASCEILCLFFSIRGTRRTITRAGTYPRGYRKPENAPRGRMSAYAFFIQTCREEHKQKHPGETIVFREFSRKCADRWKVTLILYRFFVLLLESWMLELYT